jgi:UDP-N-acetylmuramoylalanine--D-glutamate ligase
MKRRLVILGGGESGTGTAVLGVQQGFEVFLSDGGVLQDNYRRILDKHLVVYEEGGHTKDRILVADEVVKSPGIPDEAPVVAALLERGIPVISEIEFAGRYTDAVMLCVTGSNGKTTTTLLLYHILKQAGLNVGLAGNVGQSFALQVATCHYDYYVLEISSFQLDGMFRFRANVAILTNITPDHLDRYGYDFSRYVASKFRILQNQTEEDAFIYSADDPATVEGLQRFASPARMLPFTLRDCPAESGAWVSDYQFAIRNHQNIFTMYLEKLALQGKHNISNSMAAGIAAMLMNVRDEQLRESLADFQQVEHRLEVVARVHGVEFINDSKATNVNATWYALECQTRPVIWIAGGIDKGNDYSMLYELAGDKVKGLVCLGVDNAPLVANFSSWVPAIAEARSMIDAVKAAYAMADDGDVVLLSPSCASFDLFDNYEDRGRQFKQAVREL